MRLIDSHVHFWRIGQNGQTWPGPELPEIHRDYLAADFAEASAGVEVGGVIAVQSQPDARDTDWLLSLAADSDLIVGVVGWADLEELDAPARIERLARRPKLRGLRPMLQDMADLGWINRPGLQPAFAAMARLDLVLDALVRPAHLPHLDRFAERNPGLRIVIDHAAKPEIAAGRMEPWRSQLAELARRPNVCCKLSGLSSETAPGQPAASVAPYIEAVLAVFAPARVLWGSDWPVVDTRSSYRAWLSACLGVTDGMSEVERNLLFSETASSVYRLQ